MHGYSKAVSISSAGLLAASALLWLTACDHHPPIEKVDGAASSAPAEKPAVVPTSATENSSAEGPSAERAQRPKLKPGARTKVLTRAGDRPYDKTFDDLRFEMEVGSRFVRSMLTKEIEALDHSRIRIRGYMLFGAQNRGIKQFVLVRDNQECCFGPGAALFDCILVDMPAGKTIDYTRLPIAVEGIFNIREFEIGGRQMAIYQMDAETVK